MEDTKFAEGASYAGILSFPASGFEPRNLEVGSHGRSKIPASLRTQTKSTYTYATLVRARRKGEASYTDGAIK